ncbi:DUF192 domain-containing protein [Acetobacterium fimetarium]|uniref:DUF192 domain-containing protein n=1 Tax=Acetobacterium fimetarium TaxID=52691 RepID=A0ABR6WUP7_9FIRM|nr:DUF192 domain-containing protein [Acetobacterium fimetarium]MBC3804349.1 DUF192 domain-containing protein [Acetobacterium fimetarium]
MEIYQAIRDDIVLFTKVKLANDFFTRLVGLLKTKSLDSQQGLLLKKCRQVHTFGMKFNIDVVFLSREGEILDLEKNMVPGRISRHVKEAYWVLELESGAVARQKLETHQKITFTKANAAIGGK